MSASSDMDPIARKNAQRTRFLLDVYDQTDGRVRARVNMFDVGAKLGFTREQTDGIVEYLVHEDLVEFPYLGNDISLTHGGVAAAEDQLTANTVSADSEPSRSRMPDRKKVFVVHGRDEALRRSMFDFLRAMNLEPLEWSEAVRLTGKGSPYIGEVLDAAFASAQAALVLLTPDDEVRLLPDLCLPGDPDDEREFRHQARPNVLFEAGMAFGRNPDRTVLVEVGPVKRFSDIAGRHTISNCVELAVTRSGCRGPSR